MPISSTDLLIFLTAALSLNLTPGNDMMYVLGQSLKGGAAHAAFRQVLALRAVRSSISDLWRSALPSSWRRIRFSSISSAMRVPAYLVWIAYTTLTSPLSALAQDSTAAQHICGFPRRGSGQPVQSQDHCLHVCLSAALHPAGKWFAASAAFHPRNDFQCGRNDHQLRGGAVCGKNRRRRFPPA